MNRRLAVVLMLAATSAFAADLPAAESLLDRYVEVTGGKQAYAARKSEVARRTMEYPAMGLKGKAMTYYGEAGQYRASIELPGIGVMEFGVTDGIAWQNSMLTGPRILTGAERAEAMKDATLDAEYNWRKLYSKAETVGEEAFNGEASYLVRMTPNGDEPESWFFSTKSGLLLGMRSVTSTQQGDVPVEIAYGEYKSFGGIQKPSKETQKAAGQEFTLALESIEVNVEIPAAQFSFPADVAALVAKQAK
jgi:hypothetical protein